MKKFLSIAAALAMITVTAISVSAAEVTPQTEENASTSFSYEYKFDPSYTVTIPSQVTLTTEGTPVEIKAENVANLDGKKGIGYYCRYGLFQKSDGTSRRKR